MVALARSEVRNSRDIAGALLRSCIVPKVSYLCRTVRPDLLLRARQSFIMQDDAAAVPASALSARLNNTRVEYPLA